MYGLLIQAIADYVKNKYSEEVWNELCHDINITETKFDSHQIYRETLLPMLADQAACKLSQPREHMLSEFGSFFVTYVVQYGYGNILRVLGRNLRDFLVELDNLHDYLRFSYPQLKPPSFFVEEETRHGLVLHYRSRRRYPGYVHYVSGQLKMVAKKFYNIDLQVSIIKEEIIGNRMHTAFQLDFDNHAFKEHDASSVVSSTAGLSLMRHNLRAPSILRMFPFHIVFDSELVVKHIGTGLLAVLPDIVGFDLSHLFTIVRPMIDFSWESILSHSNTCFELVSIDRVTAAEAPETDRLNATDYLETIVGVRGNSFFNNNNDEHDDDDDDDDRTNKNKLRKQISSRTQSTGEEAEEGIHLRLKGTMKYISAWNSVLYIGVPIVNDLGDLLKTGLFLNDLSMHDSSRDLVLAGTQQSAELKLALDQQLQKSEALKASMKRLEYERQRTGELLNQMMPKSVAAALMSGLPALHTCQVYDETTILFSHVYMFDDICRQLTPLQVVALLNEMYVIFDELLNTHTSVYKVETVNDSYMLVSGAPQPDEMHAKFIIDFGLAMLDNAKKVTVPGSKDHVSIKLGAHSGTVVGGVVGVRTPRYCLFGDAVNTAARMESNSLPMRLHVSETCMKHIRQLGLYTIEPRGTVEIKGKGKMATYWVAEAIQNDEQ